MRLVTEDESSEELTHTLIEEGMFMDKMRNMYRYVEVYRLDWGILRREIFSVVCDSSQGLSVRARERERERGKKGE